MASPLVPPKPRERGPRHPDSACGLSVDKIGPYYHVLLLDGVHHWQPLSENVHYLNLPRRLSTIGRRVPDG
jgi:hypothetical protein